jgi:hypothetical protein
MESLTTAGKANQLQHRTAALLRSPAALMVPAGVRELIADLVHLVRELADQLPTPKA